MADASRWWSGALAARVTWAALPLTVGPALAEGLDGASGAVGATAAGMGWATWTAVLVGVLVPRTVGLTLLRVAAPAVVATAGWASLAGAGAPAAALALAWAAATVLAATTAATTDAFVDGSSYGHERRFGLRVPPALLAGPAPLAWLATAGPVVAAPVLAAAGSWVPAALVTAAGAVLVPRAVRALHGLSRRWVVFVPAGLVVHDPLVLADPVLFPTGQVHRLGLALEGTAALDLTRGALGLAVELEVERGATVELRPASRSVPGEVVAVERLLLAPLRPGALLTEAAERGLRVAIAGSDA